MDPLLLFLAAMFSVVVASLIAVSFIVVFPNLPNKIQFPKSLKQPRIVKVAPSQAVLVTDRNGAQRLLTSGQASLRHDDHFQVINLKPVRTVLPSISCQTRDGKGISIKPEVEWMYSPSHLDAKAFSFDSTSVLTLLLSDRIRNLAAYLHSDEILNNTNLLGRALFPQLTMDFERPEKYYLKIIDVNTDQDVQQHIVQNSPVNLTVEEQLINDDIEVKKRLYEILGGSKFTLSELEDLCYRLGFHWDNIPGDYQARKARCLIDCCQKTRRIDTLVYELLKSRPDLADHISIRAANV